MTREALKKLNEKQMNYCKTLSALIDRAKIKGLKEENERNRGKLRGFLECMEQMELLSGYEVNNYPWNVNTNIGARGACDLVRTLQAQSSTEYWQGLRKG